MDDVLYRCEYGGDRIMQMVKNSSKNVLRSNFSRAVNGLIKLSQIEKFAFYLQDTSKSYWIPNEDGNSIVTMKNKTINANISIKESVLGGLLNLGFSIIDIQPLFQHLTMENIKTNPQVSQNIQAAFGEYRLIIQELQNGLSSVFQNLIKIKNKKCKNNVLRLISYFIYVNLDRGKMRFDHRTVSSDSFMLNLNYILLKLCDPIIKKNMLNKIDSKYFLLKKSANYMTWEDVTRLSCDGDELKEYTEKLYHDTESKDNDNENYKPTFGFTTEIFCLTMESLHLGFSCICNELNRMQIHLDRLRRDARNNPIAAMMINMNIAQLEKRLLALIAHLMEQRVECYNIIFLP